MVPLALVTARQTLGWPLKRLTKYQHVGFPIKAIRENIKYPRGLPRTLKEMEENGNMENGL